MKVFEGTDKEYYMDGFLNNNLNTAKKVIKADWDMMFLVDGGEGGGKTVLTLQCAYYCDPTLTIERVCFTPKEFQNAVLTAQPFQAVIYDEAYTGLASRSTMSNINKIIVSMLAEIRQKNLFIFIVMPTFFDLDKYVAIWRSRALMHVYHDDNFGRGYFAFFNVDKKKKLYILGKKFYNYAMPKPDFFGRFTSFYPIDEKAYKKKKHDSLMAKKDEPDRKPRGYTADELLKRLILNDKVLDAVKWDLLGISEPTFYRYKREILGESSENNEKEVVEEKKANENGLFNYSNQQSASTI